MNGVAAALGAYVSARMTTSRWRSRASFEVWQQRQLAAWVQGPARRVSFYRNCPADLAAFPIIDKATVMSSFETFNVAGITAQEAWLAIEGTRRIGDYTVGASTGTSGNRGLFVISENERFRWLGTILAKALPDVWRTRHRVAVVLPTHTRLYDSANATHRIELQFFDLTQPLEIWRKALDAFRPTVIIAPPKILRHLADEKAAFQPVLLYSAAETLDAVDRSAIERHFSGRLGEIYMATEGLLGVTCKHGAMHLAEDCNFFEFEAVAGDTHLVAPIITNFRRTAQIMARYRMNDLLRLADTPCTCGSALRVVREIAGRMDDVFHLDGARGTVMLTPDILRNTILDADRRITDFRLKCLNASELLLLLPHQVADEAAQAARQALDALLTNRGCAAALDVRREALTLDSARKLRRVENLAARRAA